MQKIVEKILRYLRYFFALFTQAKSFKDNPIIGNPLLNRCGLHILRILIAHGIIRFRQLLLFFLVPRKDRQQYFTQGYIIKENFLDQETFWQLKKEFDSATPQLQAHTQGDTTTLSSLLHESGDIGPTTRKLMRNANYLNLLRFCYGMFLSPWVYYLRVHHQAIDTKSADPQKHPHIDAFHPTMKAWLFLDDVTAEHGPFTYYPGSQKLSWKRLKWEYQQSIHAHEFTDIYAARGSFRISPDTIKKTFNLTPTEFTVPANTLVIANTFGFHCRGQASQSHTRDSVWASSWRAPFLPIPLPDCKLLRDTFYRIMKKNLRGTPQ